MQIIWLKYGTISFCSIYYLISNWNLIQQQSNADYISVYILHLI